jgi:hypothetical protein
MPSIGTVMLTKVLFPRERARLTDGLRLGNDEFQRSLGKDAGNMNSSAIHVTEDAA